jgi:hypothetical protein
MRSTSGKRNHRQPIPQVDVDHVKVYHPECGTWQPAGRMAMSNRAGSRQLTIEFYCKTCQELSHIRVFPSKVNDYKRKEQCCQSSITVGSGSS